MAAADNNGFIVKRCHTVLRDTTSLEGAAGTINADYFLYWMKEYLYPPLGNYKMDKPCSDVFMDNTPTHMTEEVEAAIKSTGAELMYGTHSHLTLILLKIISPYTKPI